MNNKIQELLEEAEILSKQLDYHQQWIKPKGATKTEIGNLEKQLGKNLPDDYKSFLTLYDGLVINENDDIFFSIPDQLGKGKNAKQLKEHYELLKDIFEEDEEDEDEDDSHKDIIVIGIFIQNIIYYVPSKLNDAGEMMICKVDDNGMEQEYQNFVELLEDIRDFYKFSLKQYLKQQKKYKKKN